MGTLKTKLQAIQSDYNDSIDICDELMGIGYKVEAKKINDIIETFSGIPSDYGNVKFNKQLKMTINPQITQKVTEAEALEIRNLFKNGSRLNYELHNGMGGGSQIGIADGNLYFDVPDMCHVYLIWKEGSERSGFDDGPVLSQPYWYAMQAWDVIDKESANPCTQEDMNKIIEAFNTRWAAIDEGYVQKQYGGQSTAITSDDIENMKKLNNYLVKFTGASFAEVSE